MTTVDTAGGTLDGNVQLTLEGLNVAFDDGIAITYLPVVVTETLFHASHISKYLSLLLRF